MAQDEERHMFPLTKGILNGMASLALLVSGVVVAGCVPESFTYQSGYAISVFGDHKTLTVTEGVARFSFDYPLRYTIHPAGGFSKYEGSTWVHLRSPQEGTQGRFVDISVSVQKANGATFLSGIEERLAMRRGSEDSLLLERTPVEVAGLKGEQVLYSYAVGRDERKEIKPVPAIAREVFFGDSNLGWQVRLFYYVTTPELAAGYEIDLRQVLTTLRIEQ